MNKTLTVGIVLLLLIAAIVYFMSGDTQQADLENNGSEASMTETEATEMNENGTAAEAAADATAPRNSVLLAPTETGMSVVVSSAVLTEPGYVVIYRVNSQNETEVIGHSDLLDASAHSNLEIQLDERVARQQTVVAVLHKDDGDGEFEFPGADFYLGDASQAVVTDVDVVDIDAEDEDAVLQGKVEGYLEENIEA